MDTASIRAFVRRRFSREEAVGLYFTLSLLACGVLVVAFGLLAREVFETAAPSGFDASAGGFLYGLRSPRTTALMKAITSLGHPAFLLVGTAVICAGLVLLEHRISALLFAGSVAGGFALNSALKLAFARARPDAWPALVKETTYSFPSGHAAMSTVFFGGAVAVVFHLYPARGPRALAAGVAAACVLAVAVSRVYLGAHWATDTLAGVLVGLFWVMVYAGGVEAFGPRRRARGGET
ncbi:MAG TPA: phosphatase PAP2 family protein [Thermoanaerobaculia bacterium]|jgi:undecaprenyl-diphosphatase